MAPRPVCGHSCTRPTVYKQKQKDHFTRCMIVGAQAYVPPHIGCINKLVQEESLTGVPGMVMLAETKSSSQVCDDGSS